MDGTVVNSAGYLSTDLRFEYQTWQFTAVWNSDSLFWPLQAPSTHVVHRHTCSQIFTYIK